MRTPAPPLDAIPSVGAFTEEVRQTLSRRFEDRWVRGELSGLRVSAAGHAYLTLKDHEAVLPAVLWRSSRARLAFDLVEGADLLAFGSLDVYPPHGRYQFVIRHLEPLGEGALRLAFEALRRRLEAEGLFERARKKPLPRLPLRVALVTSKSGAALRDLITVIHRRCPITTLVLLSVRVQGEGASDEIARALERADRHARAQVIVVGRGGGSLEDLNAFNTEVVARAIAACQTPVVSAVGHEVDVTISDLVADVRAATPSHAGEIVVPALTDLRAGLDRLSHGLLRALRRLVERGWHRLEALAERAVLRQPRRIFTPVRARLDRLGQRLVERSPSRFLQMQRAHLLALDLRLSGPVRARIELGRRRFEGLRLRGLRAPALTLERRRAVLGTLEARLEALSPAAVLQRGYSLTWLLGVPGASPQLLRRAQRDHQGARLRTQFFDGSQLESRVEEVRPTESSR